MAKTKLIMSAKTRKISHSPASKHIVEKVKYSGGKRANKKVMVKC